ncbi:hypothetical protein [Staphylococcus caledonicus]|uniref:hypothetical protein n=1 Tax=Staphylococcus caledonicus TaxID=2741333 RepID=UPI0018E485E6|nr:hypothetical protein [Staphylococcus caledonicus]MBI5973419.1 hypothetical protein [Staphylococcus caledonicus]
MTITKESNQAIADAWSVLFEDSNYQAIINELEAFLNRTRDMVKQRYSIEDIDNEQLPKI